MLLNQSKPLSFREKKMLERARYLLVSELAMAKNCEEGHVEEMLSKALSKSTSYAFRKRQNSRLSIRRRQALGVANGLKRTRLVTSRYYPLDQPGQAFTDFSCRFVQAANTQLFRKKPKAAGDRESGSPPQRPIRGRDAGTATSSLSDVAPLSFGDVARNRHNRPPQPTQVNP